MKPVHDASEDVKIAVRDIYDKLTSARKDIDKIKTKSDVARAIEDLNRRVASLEKGTTFLDFNDVFRGSGPAHSIGYVPDPGAAPGTFNFLCEDGKWHPPGWSGSANRSFGITTDAGASTIAPGLKGILQVPYTGTITRWTLLASQSGNLVMDVWKSTVAGVPPTAAGSITGSEKPTLSSQQMSEDTTLSTWNTAIAAGNTIAFNIDSVSLLRRVTLVVWVNV